MRQWKAIFLPDNCLQNEKHKLPAKKAVKKKQQKWDF